MVAEIIGQDACTNCRYKFTEPNGTTHVCRRYPPQVYPVIGQGPGGQPVHMGDISMPPKVQLNGWCGEYVRKLVLSAPSTIDAVS